jgi:transcriptional regulator with XRE-family HTH domain
MEKRIRKTEIKREIILLGKRIEEIIREKGLKTREVAHDADLDVENLRKYIKGRQEMKVSTMLKIAKALGVTAGELVNGLEIDVLERK